MFFYKIPAPNEAMVVSGSKRGSDGGQFRIVTGRGAFVLPWKNKARWLSLDLREALISESCVTKLRIPLTVEAVAVFKVGDDNPRSPTLHDVSSTSSKGWSGSPPRCSPVTSARSSGASPSRRSSVIATAWPRR